MVRSAGWLYRGNWRFANEVWMSLLNRIQPGWLRQLIFYGVSLLATIAILLLIIAVGSGAISQMPQIIAWEKDKSFFQYLFPLLMLAAAIWYTRYLLRLRSVRSWIKKGIELGRIERHEEALVHYDQALKLIPKYPYVWLCKGVALDALKRHEDALAAYDRALALSPYYEEAWRRKSFALSELKRYDEALIALEKILDINPRYPSIWTYLGNAYWLLQRYDDALAAYDRSLTLAPTNLTVWRAKGASLARLQRYAEALAATE